MPARSLAALVRHAGQALFAASMAARVSAAPRLATSTSFWHVAGSCTGKRLAPPVHWTFTSASVLRRLASASEARGEVFMSMVTGPSSIPHARQDAQHLVQ